MKQIYREQLIELIKKLRFGTNEDEVVYKIFDGITHLKPIEQRALELRFIAGVDYSTIAEVLGKSRDESEQLAFRALRRLRHRVFDISKA